jgi:hypothetical protein
MNCLDFGCTFVVEVLWKERLRVCVFLLSFHSSFNGIRTSGKFVNKDVTKLMV